MIKAKTTIQKGVLEVVVFCSGMAVMIVELLGARLLAPYLGSSIFVWTSIIGVILGSLAFGYFSGGRIADRIPRTSALALILCIAGSSIGFVAMFKDSIVFFITSHASDVRFASVLASLVLFAIPSIFLGMVSPCAVRLRMRNVELSGHTVGNLSSLSTIGSIVGTFLTGFVLIPLLAHGVILYMLAALLLVLSLFAFSARLQNERALLVVFFFILGTVGFRFENPLTKRVIERDTLYNRVWIADTEWNGQPGRVLFLDGSPHSGIRTDATTVLDEVSLFPYVTFYRLDEVFHPRIRNGLLLGGGALSFARDFHARFPDATLDVVEIDPTLHDIAKEFFHYTDSPQVRVVTDDARHFLRTRSQMYDVIYQDVFNSTNALPFHLATRQAAHDLYRALRDGGILLVNVIVSGTQGDEGRLFQSLYKTFQSVFPSVLVFPLVGDEHQGFQNMMFLARKSPELFRAQPHTEDQKEMLAHLWEDPPFREGVVFTDDYAPVEYMVGQMLIR